MHSMGEQIATRTLSTGEAWTYSFTRGTSGQYDTTIVNGPEGTTTYHYLGYGYSISTQAPPVGFQNTGWMVGQLMQEIDPTGAEEDYSWQPRLVVSKPNYIDELGTIVDQNVWAAELTQRTITRDGTTYTTAFSNYDSYGNPGTMVESGPSGGNRTTTVTYLVDTNKWIIGRPHDEIRPGQSIQRAFDANGNMTSMTRDGVTTSYSYDAQGNVASKTQPRNLTETFSNYKRGTPQTTAEPEQITLHKVIDDAGRVSSETDGAGNTRTYTYDGLGRVASITYPQGNATSIVYTPTTKVATRGSLVESTTYDGFGRAASVTLAGIATTYTHDYRGRKVFQSNPGASIGTSYQYDALDRVTRVTNADNTYKTLTYGPGTVATRDENSHVTTEHFRSYGDPEERYLVQVDEPVAAASITITRGSNDQVSSVSQSGVTRSYGYDSRNFLVSESHPEVGTITYGRDDADNMVSRQVGAAGITNYAYDGQNRLTVLTLPDGTTSTRTYTKTNKLYSVQSSTAVRSFGYDYNDNLTSETLNVDGYNLTVGYGYNANDQLASVTYPILNHVVSFAPDQAGRPTQAAGYVQSVTYWPSGQIQQISYANGTTTSYGQNSRLWPSTFVTASSGGALTGTSYGYDGVGNLTGISDTVDAAYNRSLSYDGIDRVTTANGPWGSGSIGYDGAGNIVNQTFGSKTLNYSYDGNNRLSGIPGERSAAYTYDTYGDVVSAGGKTFSYNDIPVLQCGDCGSLDAVAYAYDGLNRGVWSSRSGLRTYELYDSRGDLVAQYTPNGGGQLVEEIYLSGKRVAQRISSQEPATTLTATKTTLNSTPAGATLTISVGSASGGTVTFSENGQLLGEAAVQGGQATVVLQGLSLGTHTITASYSGSASNAPVTLTFTVRVQNLAWLAPVMQLLLGN